MSFDVYVPCNCLKKKKMNIPPFMNKLEVISGRLELKKEFWNDQTTLKEYRNWKFCEHNQIAIEYSISGVTGWRTTLPKEYGNKFDNFRKFIPENNHWQKTNYDKFKAISEIQEYNKLEKGKYEYRLNQFINLLNKAIEMGEEIYWE